MAIPTLLPPRPPGVDLPIRNLFGLPVHALTLHQVLERVDDAIARRTRLRIAVVNAAKVVNMQRNAALRDAVVSSDLVLADGMSVVWASRLLGERLPERVAGVDLMLAMLQRSHDRRYRVYCLGAREDVLARTADRIAVDYPAAVLAGRHHGYFSPDQARHVADAIAAAAPDILLVAMTSPKKEEFLARWADELHVPVCHGVGGSFDVLAGVVRRAPSSWQRLGLEWLFRVWQEPRRLWKRYLVTNALFCLLVAQQMLRGRTARRRPRAIGPSAR